MQPPSSKGGAEWARKVVVCLIAVVSLMAAIPAVYAYPSSEYLELVSIEETADEHGAIFSGTIRNTHHAQTLGSVQVRLVIKKDGKVIYVEEKRLDDIEPGDTASFTIETLFKPEEYDEFYLMPAGWEDDPTTEQIRVACADAGREDCRVDFIAESVNITRDRVYAELYNGTSSTLDVQSVAMELLDARGNRLEAFLKPPSGRFAGG